MSDPDVTRERIDTLDGITNAIGNGDSLAGFTALITERRRWVKEHPSEPLAEWYIFNGRVYLDKFGQVSVVTFAGDVRWVQGGTVQPELRTTWTHREIPRDTDRCVHCDGAFTARQLGSIFVAGHNRSTDRLNVFHGECAILHIDAERRDEFSVAFKKAELALPTLYSMPSRYAETEWTGPWYRVESPELGALLIGWRKSVIHLGWESSAVLAHVDGEKLFADEGVTVGNKMVHAWGADKLSEYLGRLRKAAP